MGQKVEGLDELSEVSREIEKLFQGELPERISVNVSGEQDYSGGWNSLTVRVNDPEEGTVFERDYLEKPHPDRVLGDYHKVN